VDVRAPGQDGSVIGAINLHEVDYRYSDAGGTSDIQYSASSNFGWLNGTTDTTYGTNPNRLSRVNQDSNVLQYRYDQLNVAKQY
jgi:hypothetical protein